MRPAVIVRSYDPTRDRIRLIRLVLVRALLILAVAAAGAGIVHALGWMAATDRQVSRASLQAYCTGVVTWQVEASRGVAAEHRTGHPDWKGTAAEQCPGMRPAGSRQGILDDSTERQLAKF